MTRYSIAEVVERPRGKLARVGYRRGEGILSPIAGADAIAAGTFVEVAIEPDADIVHARRDDEGEPIVLAAAETALAELYRIAARNDIRMGTSPDIERETSAIVASPGIDDPALVDLTHLPFVTIDYDHSRDLDQALFICRTDGGFTILYALADASFYIKPSIVLFDEALARGTSYYLPGLTIPMLPSPLSEGILSLNEGRDRRAFVFRITIDLTGAVVSSEIMRARCRSRAKLTYDGVQAYIDAPTDSALAGREFTESLDLLAEVGRLRIADANRRQVVRYDRVAVRLGLSHAGATRLSVRREDRGDVHKWNEQISLVTNMEGAALLAVRDDVAELGGLFRVHPAPSEQDLAAFTASIDHLVDELELDATWRWRRARETLADYIERLPDDGPGWRLSRALQRQAMIMGRPSTFAVDAAPHFGVGAPAYSRFSSPMREIVGVVTMHIAWAKLAGEPLNATGLTARIIGEAIASGNRARRTQKTITRQANKLAIDQLFADELERDAADRPVRTGTVLGMSTSKIYVQLDDPPIEVKLYVADQQQLLGMKFALINRFELRGARAGAAPELVIRVGDELRVRVCEYTSASERWVLRIEV